MFQSPLPRQPIHRSGDPTGTLPGSRAIGVSLERTDGLGRVIFRGVEQETHVLDLFQRAPSRVMFPRIAGRRSVTEAVLVNTAGGIAGGDRLVSEVTVLDGASVAMTSQAAEKVYRALDEPARMVTRLTVHRDARLAWLPQETILFDRARLVRQTEIELTSGSELLALEWLVFGRAAHGEQMHSGFVSDGWRVRRDGRLIWADTFRAGDATLSKLHKNALLAGCRAIATLIYSGPHLQPCLSALRSAAASVSCFRAATVIRDVIVLRLAARLASDLKEAVRNLLQRLGNATGPGPFQVPKMWSC